MLSPDNEYAGFRVGQLVTPAEATPLRGELVLIEYISVSENVIRYRWLKRNEVFEKECFSFMCRYMTLEDSKED